MPGWVNLDGSGASTPVAPLSRVLRPVCVGVLVGGEHSSAGLHNVTLGILHFLRRFCDQPYRLIGFRHGLIGLLKADTVTLGAGPGADAIPLGLFCNRGGCDILSTRPLKALLSHESQGQRAVAAMKQHGLDGLVLCVGREDIIAAAHLAERVAASADCKTRVIVVPHGSRGDFCLPDVLPITLGFDTARRTIAELTGNIATDSGSSKKYYHFIRSGSSLLTLEASLVTRPTLTLLAEEARRRGFRLADMIKDVADVICMRASILNKHSGCVLLSDRFVEALPETDAMLAEFTRLATIQTGVPMVVANPADPQAPEGLSPESRLLFLQLPKSVRHHLLTHCNGTSRPTLPPIYTEVLVSHLVDREIRSRGGSSTTTDHQPFQFRTHDLQHECYSAIPTDFDCTLGYCLGHTAAALVAGGHHGMVACARFLDQSVDDWVPCGVSVLQFLGTTKDGARRVCVPKRTLEMQSPAYNIFHKHCRSWKVHCLHRSPGPIQFVPGRVRVCPNDLPLVLRAQYMTPEEFERLVQTEEAHRDGTVDDTSAGTSQTRDHAVLHGISLKTRGQLTELQVKRLHYRPRLPRLFDGAFTLDSSDVTARLASRPALLRATFPLTHNLRALEVVPVGLRLSEVLRLGTEKWTDDTRPPMSPAQRENDLLPRSKSNVSLCGFVGTSSVLRVPVEGLTSTTTFTAVRPAASGAATTGSYSARPSPTLKQCHPPAPPPPRAFEPSSTSFRCMSQSRQQRPPRREDAFPTIGRRPPIVFETGSQHIATGVDTPHLGECGGGGSPASPQVLDKLWTQRRRGPAESSSTGCPTVLTATPVASSYSCDRTHVSSIIVCFLGRPAPGAMNVLWGLKTYTSKLDGGVALYGAVSGLAGVVHQRLLEITDERLELYRNQGGIELLGRSSEHCGSESDLDAFLATCQAFKARGLVLAGGVATISTAALLAEHFLQRRLKTAVIAVPMTVDSGIPGVEVSLGHDTTVRVFSNVIGSIMSEARTAKRWYFLRVSGRNLSHLCAECALETCPTLVLICEEVEKKKMTLIEITNFIADVVEARAEKGMVYGVVLLSDSLLDHVPEVRMLFNEINTIFEATADTLECGSQVPSAHPSAASLDGPACDRERRASAPAAGSGVPLGRICGGRRIPQTEDGLAMLRACLTPWGAALFSSLPPNIRWQFAFSKDLTQRVLGLFSRCGASNGSFFCRLTWRTSTRRSSSRRWSRMNWRDGSRLERSVSLERRLIVRRTSWLTRADPLCRQTLIVISGSPLDIVLRRSLTEAKRDI